MSKEPVAGVCRAWYVFSPSKLDWACGYWQLRRCTFTSVKLQTTSKVQPWNPRGHIHCSWPIRKQGYLYLRCWSIRCEKVISWWFLQQGVYHTIHANLPFLMSPVINCTSPTVNSRGAPRMSNCGNHFGAQCNFTCAIGHRLNSSSTVECVAPGNRPPGVWDNPLPSCQGITK